MEHSAKNQKSAKKQICGFFHFPEKSQKNPKTGYFFIFGAGAPVKKRVKFRHGPQKRVTELPPIGRVFYLTWSNIRRAGASAGAKCFSDGVPCADYSAVPNQCQVFSVTPSIFGQVNASSCQGADYTVLQRCCQVLSASCCRYGQINLVLDNRGGCEQFRANLGCGGIIYFNWGK